MSFKIVLILFTNHPPYQFEDYIASLDIHKFHEYPISYKLFRGPILLTVILVVCIRARFWHVIFCIRLLSLCVRARLWPSYCSFHYSYIHQRESVLLCMVLEISYVILYNYTGKSECLEENLDIPDLYKFAAEYCAGLA